MFPEHPINTFSRHYRTLYGEPVGKIMLATGRTCPNRARGGCIYCAPESFTPFYLNVKDNIAVQLEKGKRLLLGKRFRLYFAYFQQETTTATPTEELIPMLTTPLTDKDCVGLIVSTRPDCVEDNFLQGLAKLIGQHADREFILELGLQSSHNQTLALLNRNHTFADFDEAVRRIRKIPGITLSAHLILGLPGEGLRDMLATVRTLTQLGLEHVKFHHLQVVRGTKLAVMHEAHPIPLFNIPQYMETIALLLAELPWRVVVHRLWAAASPELLLAPRWNKYANELSSLLLAELTAKELYQGKYAEVA